LIWITRRVSWPHADGTHRIKLLPDHTYVLPSGYKIEMLKPARGSRWRLIGEVPEGTVCHKPCTVSGGGKSEISKPIADAMIDGPVFIADFRSDFDLVESIIHRDFKMRYRDAQAGRLHQPPLLSDKRTLGSVIKLLTPSADYNDAYNQLAQHHPAIHQGPRVRGEALLQAGLGRGLAQPVQRGHGQRQAGQ
jgi:hypothetical protein